MTAIALTSIFITFINPDEEVRMIDYLWGTLFDFVE